MDAPFWGLLGQWGPDALAWSLVAAIIWALLAGRLKTRRDHEDRVTDLKERIQELAGERDGWKSAHETTGETVRTLIDQNEKLMAMGAVTNQLLSSLKGQARES